MVMATKSSALHLYDLKFLIQIKKAVQVSKRVPPGEGRDLPLSPHVPPLRLSGTVLHQIDHLLWPSHIYADGFQSELLQSPLCLIETLQLAFVS